MLKDTCEQVHLGYSNHRLETPASNDRGENSVRVMKEMIYPDEIDIGNLAPR